MAINDLENAANGREWVRCYRTHAKMTILGIAATLFFLAIPVVGAIVTLVWAPPDEKLTVFLLIAFLSPCWIPMIAIAVYLLVAARRYRLFLGDEVFYQRELIGEQLISLEEIQGLWWQTIPDGGQITAYGHFGKVTISLAMLRPVDRRNVIAWFRRRVPKARQGYYEAFLKSTRRSFAPTWQTIGISAVFAALFFATGWCAGVGMPEIFITIVGSAVAATLVRWLMVA